MDKLMEIGQWILANWRDMAEALGLVCLAGSIVVKLTPTLKDDNWFKPLIKFIGKYVAVDKYAPPTP